MSCLLMNLSWIHCMQVRSKQLSVYACVCHIIGPQQLCSMQTYVQHRPVSKLVHTYCLRPYDYSDGVPHHRSIQKLLENACFTPVGWGFKVGVGFQATRQFECKALCSTEYPMIVL